MVVFGLDEVGQHVLVAPALGPVVRPVVVVVTIASEVLHVVEVATSAQSLPRRPYAHLADILIVYMYVENAKKTHTFYNNMNSCTRTFR